MDRTQIIDPIFDTGFKLIFGRENVSERLLIDLLNSIFAGDPVLGDIVEVRFTNTEKPDEYVEGRGIRYDISCVTSTGHRFIVEMQKGEQTHFIERCEYYVARDLAGQGFRGRDSDSRVWDFSLMPVVGIFFCNFRISHIEHKPLTYAALCDLENGKPIGDSQRYVFIQLPCFGKEKDDCESDIDKWIYNIKNMGAMQTVSFTTDKEIFQYLESVSNVAALTGKDRYIYESALRRARDYNAVLKTAEEKAKAKGLAEGRAEGRAEGEAEKAEAIANKMKQAGFPISTIMEMTGLSETVIEAL